MSDSPRAPSSTGERISLETYRQILAAGQAPAMRRQSSGKKKTPEEDLQRDCFLWMALHAPRYPVLRFALHVPNGGKRPRGEAGKMKALGVKKGFPDIAIPLQHGRWQGFAAELKSTEGRVSKEQAEWLEMLEKSGWLTGVCRSLQAFECLVEKYLNSHP